MKNRLLDILIGALDVVMLSWATTSIAISINRFIGQHNPDVFYLIMFSNIELIVRIVLSPTFFISLLIEG